MDRQNDRGGESGLQDKNWLYWLGPLCESRGSSTGRLGRHGGGGGGDGDGTLRRYTNPFTLRGCILTANARDVAMRMDLVSQARRNIWGHWGLVPPYFWQFQKGWGIDDAHKWKLVPPWFENVPPGRDSVSTAIYELSPRQADCSILGLSVRIAQPLTSPPGAANF